MYIVTGRQRKQVYRNLNVKEGLLGFAYMEIFVIFAVFFTGAYTYGIGSIIAIIIAIGIRIAKKDKPDNYYWYMMQFKMKPKVLLPKLTEKTEKEKTEYSLLRKIMK